MSERKENEKLNLKKKISIIIIIILALLIVLMVIIYFVNKDKVAVLCYHNIATNEEKANFLEEKEFTIDIENFEEHLKFFQKHNFKTLTMDEFYEWKQGNLKIPANSILITFDDGFLSNYQYAFPLLKKYNMNATVFVVGKYAEEAQTEEWNGNIKTYMPISLINKLEDEYPNIDICSHSYNLHYIESLNENNAEAVYEDALKFSELINDTKYFAYPFGAVNDYLLEGLEKNQERLAFIYGPQKSDFRKVSIEDDNYRVPRINVSHGMDIWKLALRLWVWL